LYFLHGTVFSAVEGSMLGAYMIHFVDGQDIEVPLMYGRHIRAARRRADIAAANSKMLAWTCQMPDGDLFRLYTLCWSNPRPAVGIRSISFKPSLIQSTPFLLAITAE
jgi:hypothetical protein